MQCSKIYGTVITLQYIICIEVCKGHNDIRTNLLSCRLVYISKSDLAKYGLHKCYCTCNMIKQCCQLRATQVDKAVLLLKLIMVTDTSDEMHVSFIPTYKKNEKWKSIAAFCLPTIINIKTAKISIASGNRLYDIFWECE